MINDDTQGLIHKRPTAGNAPPSKEDPESGGYFTASLVAVATIFLTTTIVFLGLWISERNKDDELKESVDYLADAIEEMQDQLNDIVPGDPVTSEPPQDGIVPLNYIPESAFPMSKRVSNADDSYVLKPRGEYFDLVTDTVTMKYGDTFWSNLPAMEFPDEIQQMDELAITGLEMSIWEHKNGKEVRVPAYDVYNHHVNLYYNSETQNGVRETVLGAEMAGTLDYHVEGTTFTLEDPYSVTVEPMLIYTGKPGGGRCTFGEDPDPDCPLPQGAADHPVDSDWNPLLECPCTDQIDRTITKYQREHVNEQCPMPILSVESCAEAGTEFGAGGSNVTVVNSNEHASGCSIEFKEIDGVWEPQLYFNTNSNSAKKCNERTQTGLTVSKGSLLGGGSRGEVEVYVHAEGLKVYVTMKGPADKWFGVGLGAPTSKMRGTAAWIAMTDGSLVLRILGNHTPGNRLPLSTLGVNEDDVTSEVVGNVRTVKFLMDYESLVGGSTTQAPPTTTTAAGNTDEVEVTWKIPVADQEIEAVPGTKLNFKWNNPYHNVYKMPSKEAYDACDFSGAELLGETSPLEVSYTGGTEYFACEKPGHCSAGQKLTVTEKPAEAKRRRHEMHDMTDMNDMQMIAGMVNNMMGALRPQTVVDGELVETSGRMDEEHNVAPAPVSNLLQAVGFGDTFAYHGTERAAGLLYNFYNDVPGCICDADLSGFVSGTIGGVAWGICQQPYHPDQLIDEKNNICSAYTYAGGQKCCPGGTILLDKDQVDSRPQDEKSVFLKLRVYYDPEPAEDNLSVTKMYYPPEGIQGEYDIPVTENGRHTLVVQKTLSEITGIPADTAMDFYYLQGHCHAPSCISQEMHVLDPDTGKLEQICKTEMFYGDNDEALTEKGYIVGSSICLFGNEPGLQAPPRLKGSDIIVTKKTADSTYPHWGDMAGWAMTVGAATQKVEE